MTLKKILMISASLICSTYTVGTLIGNLSTRTLAQVALTHALGEALLHFVKMASASITSSDSEQKPSMPVHTSDKRKDIPIDYPLLGKTVEKLHGKWKFESDHLPIGIEVDGFEVANWNILNQDYMSYIYQDAQGFNGSLMTTLSKSLREQAVADRVANMMQAGKEVMGLEECSPEFLETLKTTLPSHYWITFSGNRSSRNQNAIIYNSKVFQFHGKRKHVQSFTGKPNHHILDVVLTHRKTGKLYHFITVHLPKPCQSELIAYVKSLGGEPVVMMGDMNFNEKEMQKAMVGTSLQLVQPLYPTHVNTRSESRAYDQFWTTETAKALLPERVSPGVKELSKLL